MLSDEWLSRYGLLENFNASVTRTRTGTGTGTWTTGVTAIALCTSYSRAKTCIDVSKVTFMLYSCHVMRKPVLIFHKTMMPISCTVTVELICTFDFNI